MSSLVIRMNGTHRCRWDEKLGFCESSRLLDSSRFPERIHKTSICGLQADCRLFNMRVSLEI